MDTQAKADQLAEEMSRFEQEIMGASAQAPKGPAPPQPPPHTGIPSSQPKPLFPPPPQPNFHLPGAPPPGIVGSVPYRGPPPGAPGGPPPGVPRGPPPGPPAGPPPGFSRGPPPGPPAGPPPGVPRGPPPGPPAGPPLGVPRGPPPGPPAVPRGPPPGIPGGVHPGVPRGLHPGPPGGPPPGFPRGPPPGPPGGPPPNTPGGPIPSNPGGPTLGAPGGPPSGVPRGPPPGTPGGPPPGTPGGPPHGAPGGPPPGVPRGPPPGVPRGPPLRGPPPGAPRFPPPGEAMAPPYQQHYHPQEVMMHPGPPHAMASFPPQPLAHTSVSMMGLPVHPAMLSAIIESSKKQAEASAVDLDSLPLPQKAPKKKKDPKKLRTGGGKLWEDSSLDEWDPNDFRIFCGDLGNDVNDDTLARSFSKYSSFLKAKVIRDKYTKKTKGYGFVSFKDPQDFMQAMREVNGKYIGNRPVKLRKSVWKDRSLLVVKKKEKEKKRLGFR